MKGRKGGYDSLIKPRLDEVFEMFKSGMYERDIIKKLGTSKDTFYQAKKDHPELADIIRQARSEIVSDLKKSLIQRAKGYTYKEAKVIIEKDSDGNVKMQRVETVEKQVAPDTGALIFALTNFTQRDDDVFYNRQDISHTTTESDAERIGIDLDKLSLEEINVLRTLVQKGNSQPDSE